jgi:anti-sigma regulatory factor (Ser/Thr protein kinase)
VSEVRTFARRLDALPDLFAFSAQSVHLLGLDAGLVPTVDFALEELFTNMIKYSESEAEVRVEMRKVGPAVEVVMDDVGVDPFDPTARPPVDTRAPLAEREPGGLGLHLVGRLVDAIDYQYLPEWRTGRITFRKSPC